MNCSVKNRGKYLFSQKKIDDDREVITITFIEVRSGFVSVSDPPGDDTPGPWVTIIYHETVLINHGDSTHVTT